MNKYKKQIYLFLVVSLLVVIGSFTFLFFNFRKQMLLQDEIAGIEKNISLTDSLSRNLLRMESDKRGFQLTGSVEYLKNIYALRFSSKSIIRQLKNAGSEAGHAGMIAEADSLLNVKFVNIDSGIMLYTTQGLEASVDFMRDENRMNARKMIYTTLDSIKSKWQLNWNQNIAAINKKSKQNITDLLILLFVSVVMMIKTADVIKKAQEKIIKNHFKFKEAQSIARIGSWEWDLRTHKLRWSQEQFKLFGEERNQFDLTFQGYLGHLSQQDKAETIALINKAIANNDRFSVEHEIIRKDGSRIFVFEQGTVMYDQENNPVGMFGTTQDITERKRSELMLIEAQEKYQSIFDNTADGIYQSSTDGRFIMVNSSMAKIFGYESEEEMMGAVTNIGAQLYANPVERKKMMDWIMAHGHVENYEVQVLTKQKQIIWVSANIRIVEKEDGAIDYFEGTLENITNRKEAEEQLKNLSNRLQLAIKATGIGIWDWDMVNNQTIWDPEMYRIYDVEPLNSIDVNEAWSAAVHPEDLDRVNKELQWAASGEKEFDTEFRVIWRDQSVHYVQGNAIVMRHPNGMPLHMVGTNKDITVEKLAEEEILQLNKSLDQFANITAHDLQEPIRMVSGFLGLLDKKYSDVLDEQGKNYVHRAKDGADRMSILIKDLLEFSRSGNKAAKKEHVDLAVVMDQVKRDMSIVTADTNAVIELPQGLPVITGTQSAIYRLFLNLISNGIKFRKKDISPEVRLAVGEDAGFWKFTLQDNGIGVAAKDQPKLFQAFQRLHRKEVYPGTGLGLVTCKKIVEIHGGRIWMTSVEGEGTAFHFTLPKNGQAN